MAQTPGTLTIKEAAVHLGITPKAVRKRIQRGELTAEKGASGRWNVLLDAGPETSAAAPDSQEAHDRLIRLEAENDYLRQSLRERGVECAFLRERLTESLRLLDQGQHLAALPYRGTPPHVETPNAAMQRPNFWKWLWQELTVCRLPKKP
ncbi:MAG: hypothetical protein ACYDBB_21920 [Armatimonadota bacterium]